MQKKSTMSSSEMQGVTRILADSTIHVTDLVEQVQKKIIHPPFLPSTPIQHLITGISSISYTSVSVISRLLGRGLEASIAQFYPLLKNMPSFEQKEALTSVLNGVVGDYLLESKNALAIPMAFRYHGESISLDAASIEDAYGEVNGKILLLVHGLCMDDAGWSKNGHEHGAALAKALGYTPIYLRYNSGQHISKNGQDLDLLLDQLHQNWPVPVEKIDILAHSMGGLIGRSAIHYGQKAERAWTKSLKKIIFLGTPHHGAPLERVGNYAHLFLEKTPFVKPFARLTKMRSAGITDLRHGNLITEDWAGFDRFEHQADCRMPVPLPQNVDCYTVAAIMGKENKELSARLGDGLVDLDSALGQHKIADKQLAFPADQASIVYERNHMDLLSDQLVFEIIKNWLE